MHIFPQTAKKLILLFIFRLESVAFCYCFVLTNISREGPATFFCFFPPKNLPEGEELGEKNKKEKKRKKKEEGKKKVRIFVKPTK